MGANTMVLVVVAAFATLVLTSALAVVAYKTRTHKTHGKSPARACSLHQQAAAYRSEAVTSRDQLNEQRVHRLAG